MVFLWKKIDKMAVFINGVISSSRTAEWLMDSECTSLVDVIAQCKALTEGEPVVVYINSQGGELDEGFAIHDYLVNLGVPVKTVALGMCASIATVIFLAGAEREARCELMIHNPWSDAAGDGAAMQEHADVLNACEKRLEKFYAAKLGIDEDTVSNLMLAETVITQEQALALGFATKPNDTPPAMAMVKNNNQKQIKNETKMNEKLIPKILRILGFSANGDVLAMEIATADDSMLTVEREEGTPQVGDVASPDGEHLMPTGETIVVDDGVITEIREAATELEPEPDEELALANARIVELEARVATLNARQVTSDDRKAIDAVKAMGGVAALAKICSSYKPQSRVDPKAGDPQRIPAYRAELNRIKNKEK